MVGLEFFSKRLGDIYDFSLLKYTNGSGLLTSDEDNIDVSWEMCVDVSGEIIFILSSNKEVKKTSNEQGFIKFSITGECSQRIWQISSQDLIIYSKNENLGKLEEPYTYHCSVKEVFLKNTEKFLDGKLDNAKVYLTNFDFKGLELSRYENRLTMDKFTCLMNNKNVLFKLQEECKELKDLIKMKRIVSAVLSNFTLPIDMGETVSNVIDDITSICFFLGVLSLNTSFNPKTEFYKDNEIVAILLKDTFDLPYHGNVLIDNYEIEGGIKKAIELCFTHYKNLEQSIEINRFISLLLELQNQRHIELKFAVLLLAYENLLSRYFIHRGISQQQVEADNIQQKLGRLNGLLRFIPSHLSGDYLRDSIRNPLFHLGNIPFLTFEDKISEFDKYYELLIQITLRILEYKGEYINRIDYTLSKIN